MTLDPPADGVVPPRDVDIVAGGTGTRGTRLFGVLNGAVGRSDSCRAEVFWVPLGAPEARGPQ
ncbi:MAG: hypothetical protein ACJ72I_08110 [Pseudonocardiaceae bacterium]|jgi:hypothetical protein